MSGLLPLKTNVSAPSIDNPSVLTLADEETGVVFSTLSSDMTRRTLATLYEDPQTASEIAGELDTSLQNINYHLNKLQDANLIDVIDTWYSDRGTPMKVYAPTDHALLVLSDQDTVGRLRRFFSRLFGIALLVLVDLILYLQVNQEMAGAWVAGIDLGILEWLTGGTVLMTTVGGLTAPLFFIVALLACLARFLPRP